MKCVFFQTFKRMFRLKFILIYLAISLPVPILAGLSEIANQAWNQSLNTLSSEIYNFMDSYMILAFVWFCGIPVVINLAAHASGLFAAEEAEGTMVLIMIKPIKREGIILGKIFGLLTGQFVYFLISLFLGTACMIGIIRPDSDVILTCLQALPAIIIYGLIIILLFSSLICFFSALFKKKVPTLIIILVLIMLVYLGLPVLKVLMSMNTSVPMIFDFIDVNYHMGLIFKGVFLLGGVSVSPSFNHILTGTFDFRDFSMNTDPDLIKGMEQTIGRGTQEQALFVFLAYAVLALFLYGLILFLYRKRDIN